MLYIQVYVHIHRITGLLTSIRVRRRPSASPRRRSSQLQEPTTNRPALPLGPAPVLKQRVCCWLPAAYIYRHVSIHSNVAGRMIFYYKTTKPRS
jgi:hypothetical protein